MIYSTQIASCVVVTSMISNVFFSFAAIVTFNNDSKHLFEMSIWNVEFYHWKLLDIFKTYETFLCTIFQNSAMNLKYAHR